MYHELQGSRCAEHRSAHFTFRWKQFVKNSYSDLSLAELQACAEKLIHHNLEGETLDAVLELLRARNEEAKRLAAYNEELDKKLPEDPPRVDPLPDLLGEIHRQTSALERIALALERIENKRNATATGPTVPAAPREWYYPPPQSSSAPLQADHMTI